ncbi:hypothetical protein O6H91_03G107000 [Diphasiastrum complanatum]|uniref:Uncharacterized protein n=1 Tax=Diphasiastrum complanatum TaxID=34168 RepID=A0ACC2EAA8_DIPCM|nr:hypothetical protein O6H91_03G107000 [Diphasiastrum complanatum]
MAVAGQDIGWVGKKPLRRLGGMADALAMATELGYSVPQEDAIAVQNGSALGGSDKSEALVRVLRELTSVQRNLANLQVELQGRQDDESVAHLTHVSEIEKKSQILARTTKILKDVILNKDRIIARLQQPYSLDCIPVETEYQRQFAELLLKAAGDYGGLTAAISDLQWSQSFKDPPTIWGELLRPIPVALASCTRYYEALSSMREAVSTLYKTRVKCTNGGTPSKNVSCISEKADSECITPQSWNQECHNPHEPNSDDLLIRNRVRLKELNPSVEESESSVDGSHADSNIDSSKQRRMSWPPSTSGNSGS